MLGPIRESCSTVESLALTPQTNHHNKETIMDETTRPLTTKQQRFCEEYLVDLNATAAARRAGYSSRTAEQQGYQLLQIPSVQAAIEALKAARSEATGVTAEYVVERLRAVVEEPDTPAWARVTALTTLARHLGICSPTRLSRPASRSSSASSSVSCARLSPRRSCRRPTWTRGPRREQANHRGG